MLQEPRPMRNPLDLKRETLPLATISQSQLSVTSTISPANIRYTITDLARLR